MDERDARTYADGFSNIWRGGCGCGCVVLILTLLGVVGGIIFLFSRMR